MNGEHMRFGMMERVLLAVILLILVAVSINVSWVVVSQHSNANLNAQAWRIGANGMVLATALLCFGRPVIRMSVDGVKRLIASAPMIRGGN